MDLAEAWPRGATQCPRGGGQEKLPYACQLLIKFVPKQTDSQGDRWFGRKIKKSSSFLKIIKMPPFFIFGSHLNPLYTVPVN